MRLIGALALCLGFVLFLPAGPQAGLGAPEAQASSRDALYLKCRNAVVRKYGRQRINAGQRVISLDNKVAISAIDACVANGGRVI